eukprot:7743531-Pyramimonas_sp.AAC.1
MPLAVAMLAGCAPPWILFWHERAIVKTPRASRGACHSPTSLTLRCGRAALGDALRVNSKDSRSNSTAAAIAPAVLF